jgi:threonine synthase
MNRFHLECTGCGAKRTPDRPWRVCDACGLPLAAVHDLAHVRSRLDRDALARRPRGLWRFHEVLPISDAAEWVTLGEGDTPLLPVPRLGRELGLPRLLVKDESLNPTGSFKDRGMAVAVTMAKLLGARALAAPSAGNAGGALAAYGARAGLPVVIAMPRDVPLPNRLEAAACGARVELVDGTIADCGRWIGERAEREGWFDVSTLKEPYRVEGKKTMGYELAEALGWRLPDVILYPTGGGTGLVGMAKAFDEMRELGWIEPDSPAPRLVAVQAEGCAPIVTSFAAGRDRAEAPPRPHTVASGLRVPRPIGDRWMLRVLRASRGTAVAVSDGELVAGAFEMARLEGIFACPEAGALVAAARRLAAEGWISRDETVVLFNTGTGLKYPEALSDDTG